MFVVIVVVFELFPKFNLLFSSTAVTVDNHSTPGACLNSYLQKRPQPKCLSRRDVFPEHEGVTEVNEG